MSKKKWGIIEKSSTYFPWDARSQECPGHEYPAHTEVTEKLTEYSDEDRWLEEVKSLKLGRKDFRAIIFQEVEVDLSVLVNVS